MWSSPDEESAIKESLHPEMVENPELQWAFIRKIYSILIIQILLSIVVGSVAVFVPPLILFVNTLFGLVLYNILVIFAFIVLWPLRYYQQWHPVNLLLLGLFTVAISFVVRLACAITSGKVILEAAIITLVITASLTFYTFWAAKRGYDFGFLRPFLFSSLVGIIVFSLIQVFFPLGKFTTMVYGGIASLVFCAYIVADMDDLIKRYSYDEYIWASTVLYLDSLNLFVHLLELFRAFSSRR